MGNSRSNFFRQRSGLLLTSAAILVILVGLFVFVSQLQASSGVPRIGPNTVAYRYRFGGEIITQYLEDVVVITEYRHNNAVDEVVFSLRNGKDYVVNAPLIVDYTFSTKPTFERRQVLNKVYYRYDPYLQGEKQQWRKELVEENYQKYAGRLPTEAEWLEALNELTRGVEPFQMERWIQYSPPAIRYFIKTQFEILVGRAPAETEEQQYFKRLTAGESYEAVLQDLQSSLSKQR